MDLELITSILLIIGIDIVLGGDNAIVIALACRNLPENKRNKAIILGTLLAVLIRVLLTIGAVYLLQIPFLQFAGGVFLLLLAYKLLIDHDGDSSNVKAGISLLSAVRTIVIADLVMGIDNVIAVAGAAHGNFRLVILGLIISIPIIIWGSKLILIVMERFPVFIYIGAGILAYTAGKMMISEERLHYLYESYRQLFDVAPFISIFIVLLCGFLTNHIKFYRSIKN
ncbi:TerC family protein [Cytobacillus sp. S13-E01]|uniref:TerC family protein n=1 Tax=Cytobacillus sp. S13-E01 TaxID=3031326 RepID=UPI0023D80D10|nr:TerC family protein [Cytobacillus sp. S13-E01]MDF0727925.1 TerC family protein [Cytobacillus sp. S13-E01]